jgi:hypothetical protein
MEVLEEMPRSSLVMIVWAIVMVAGTFAVGAVAPIYIPTHAGRGFVIYGTFVLLQALAAYHQYRLEIKRQEAMGGGE